MQRPGLLTPVRQVILAWCVWFVLGTRAMDDECRNYPETIRYLEALCWVIVAELWPGVNCESFGPSCELACGLCDSLNYSAPVCDEDEVYEQKVALAETLRDIGVCPDCVAPEVWTEHTYVNIPAGPFTGMSTSSWASDSPGDPCRVNGVGCDRCGQPISLILGIPQATMLPSNHTPLSMFRLHALREMVILAAPTDRSSFAYIPADAWCNLPLLDAVNGIDFFTGDVPDFSCTPNLWWASLVSNDLHGKADMLFGSPSLWEILYFGQALEGGPLTERACRSREFKLLDGINFNLQGALPSCLEWPQLEVFNAVGSSLSGPVDRLLRSTKLRIVRIDGNAFTGTLPETISLGSSLGTLSLANNKISGTLPDLSNHTSIEVIDARGNRLTGAQAITGPFRNGTGLVRVLLSDNLIEEFPAAFMVLHHVVSLDLSRNQLRSWPTAGGYARGIIRTGSDVVNECPLSEKEPAFIWPEMDRLSINGNDLQGQDVRDVLLSVSYLKRLRILEANDCNMSMDVPEEGAGTMVPLFDTVICQTESIQESFGNLNSLRLANNKIKGLLGEPWESLQLFDISFNALTSMHSSWFEDGGSLLSQDYRGNPDLHLPVTTPALESGCDGASKLTLNPLGFQVPSATPDVGYECTTLCNANGVSTLVDSTLNTSALCRCKPGWHGDGISCTACDQGFYCAGRGALPRRCPANSTTTGIASLVETDCECDAGTYRVYNPPDPLECIPCPENTWRSTPNARSPTECIECEVGKFSKPGTKDPCTPCSVGTVPIGTGEGCRTCEPGTFADAVTSSCKSCPLGQFRPDAGATRCIDCQGKDAGNTTWSYDADTNQYLQSPGAKSGSECGCVPGHRPIGSSCVLCGEGEYEGLLCAGGLSSDAVTLEPGYFSEASPISVYQCWGDEKRCKGGLPGDTCKTKRRGLTCALCVDGYVVASDGRCLKCSEGSALRLAIAVLLVVAGSIAFYLLIDRHSRAKMSRQRLLLSSILSLAITTMQQLGLLSQTSIEWGDPLRSLLRACLVLNFDLNVVHIDCVSNMSPTTSFTMKVSTIFAFCVLMLVIHIASVLVRFAGRFKEKQASLTCSLGAVATLFYISVVVSISGPIQCQQHPNSKWTSRSYPSVVCWDSEEHTGMVVVAALALLLPLGYYAHAAHTVWKYPSRVHKGDSQYIKAYEFYFVRFRVETYWFILIQIGRNLILALAVIIPDSAGSIFLAILAIGSYALLIAAYSPWRTDLSNLLDVILTSCVLVLFSAGFRFIPEGSATDDTIFWICSIAVVSVMSSLPIICLIIISRSLVVRKLFSHFLCHHKAGAGAFARLLKVWLLARSGSAIGGRSSDVFLDSDCLAHLDQLFNHVRSETETLVAVWSRELLTRAWCVGELTIARVTGVRTIAVLMPDHAPLTPEFIDSYAENASLKQIFEYGLTLDMILETLAWLSEQPSILMGVAPCPKVMEALVTYLRSKRRAITPPLKALEYAPGPLKDDAVCICADERNVEAISTGMVLEKYLMFSESLGLTLYLLPVQHHLPASVRRIVCLCSGGCLESQPFLSLMADAAAKKLRSLPVVVQDSFRFPSAEEIASLESPSARIARSDPDDALRLYVIGMFKGIAVDFLAQSASDSALQLAAATISRRLTYDGKPSSSLRAGTQGGNFASNRLRTGSLPDTQHDSGTVTSLKSGDSLRIESGTSSKHVMTSPREDGKAVMSEHIVKDGDKTSIPKTDCEEASNILLDKAGPEVNVLDLDNDDGHAEQAWHQEC